MNRFCRVENFYNHLNDHDPLYYPLIVQHWVSGMIIIEITWYFS